MKYMAPKRLLFAAMSFIIILTAFVGAAIWRLREDAISDALRETDNIAMIMAEQSGHSAQAIEIILNDLIAKTQQVDGESTSDYLARVQSKETFDFLNDRLAQLPQAAVITVTDSAGHILNLTRKWPAPPVDLSDRDYFQHFQTIHDKTMFISEPFMGRVSGIWTIYFAKRLETPNGQFGGIIYVGVRPEYFIRALDAISSIPDRTLVLLREDGTVLLRYPDVINRSGFKIPASSTWHGLAQHGGHYLSEGLFEQQPQWIAVRPVSQYPLVVDVGVSQNQILLAWQTRAVVIGACCIIVDLLFVVLMISLYNQFVKLQGSEQELSSKSKHIELVNQRFDAALSNTTHGIAMFDAGGKLLIKNGKYERILGLHTIEFQLDADPDGGLLDMSDAIDLETDCDLIIKTLVRDGQSNVVNLEDGHAIRITTESMSEGGWVTTLEDITESQRANEKIIRMAHFDGLTKIANRTKFLSELQRVLSSDDLGNCGVMLLDLDHFKEVNDTYGHGLGDDLLRNVAQRLVAALRTDDLVARLGGDEFAILCSLSDADSRNLDSLAEELLISIQTAFQISGNDISVGLSIGIAIGQCGLNEVEQVMRHADLALYQAKSDGRNCYRFFVPAMEERYQSRKALTIDLQQAILRDELAVHYQPIVDAKSLEIVSMEALVRWKHSKRGMISPADFIPLAEECGLIYDLGEWVLRRACLDAAGWPRTIRIAVNVSTLQLSKPTFSRVVEQIRSESGLEARRLKLEITESVLLSETAHGIANLNSLREQGIAIILDDFGTGYSSLSYLKRFHFDEIKIDKSFVDDLGNHRGSTAIVAATITLARELDIVTTAEGVETDDQRLLLQASGVQQLQGYLFGKPAPATFWQFSEPLAKQKSLA